MSKPRKIGPVVGAFLLGILAAFFFFRGDAQRDAVAATLSPEIILFTEPDFQGHEFHLGGDAIDLPFENLADGRQVLWNDNIGSIIVISGTWRLYQHGRMNTALDDTSVEAFNVRSKATIHGWSSVISATSSGPLEIASLDLAAIGPDISSVELLSAQNLPDWIYGRK